MRKLIFSLSLFAVICIYAQPFAKMYNGHEYVDLGFSAKWATCNMGASKMEQLGSVFEWGDVTPYQAGGGGGKKYKHVTYVPPKKIVDSDGFVTWEDDYFKNIGDNISGTEYDAAHKQWGGKWCMPSLDDFVELIGFCTCESLSRNGVSGIKFTSKKNGNWIFIPTNDYYWTSFHSRLYPFHSLYFDKKDENAISVVPTVISDNKGGIKPSSSDVWKRLRIRPIWK